MHFAFQCPGQGSQSLGMLSDLAQRFSVVELLFKRASVVLGYDLWALVQAGPEAQLNQTEYTQPALLVADVAVWACWQAIHGPAPSLLAGHSLGEYAALVLAEALEFEVAVSLVALRARAMQAAVPAGKGAMLAIIGLNAQQVEGLCEQASALGVVTPANLNTPLQTIVAGEVAAVDCVSTVAKEQGAKRVQRLPVSVPSHCRLMEPATEPLAAALQAADIQPPKIPVLHNVDAEAHQQAHAIREALIKQITHPVRWTDTLLKLQNSGVTRLFECGPGTVLSGLSRRTLPSVSSQPLGTVSSLEAGLVEGGFEDPLSLALFPKGERE